MRTLGLWIDRILCHKAARSAKTNPWEPVKSATRDRRSTRCGSHRSPSAKPPFCGFPSHPHRLVAASCSSSRSSRRPLETVETSRSPCVVTYCSMVACRIDFRTTCSWPRAKHGYRDLTCKGAPTRHRCSIPPVPYPLAGCEKTMACGCPP